MVGLVSINEDRNYGAVLQAVGLQAFLEELGIDSNFICFDKDYNAVLNISIRSIKSLMKSFFTVVHYRELKGGCKRFQSFIDENQRQFPKYSNFAQLKANPPIVNGYVVGSDQVWPEGHLTPVYGLSFAQDDVRKISYAASMGNDVISDNQKEVYKEYLKDFDAISIREKTAIKSISDVYKGTVNYHIDPTMLHDESFWKRYEEPYKGKLPSKYILVYMIYVPKDVKKQLQMIKNETGLPVVLVSNTPYKNVPCDYYIRDAGPAEFLWLCHHAQGIISSSFHGVVFSLLYRKPFIAVINPEKPCRIENLLGLFHMESWNNWNVNFLEKGYDSKLIDTVLNEERERSQSYLKEHLL